jgi:hypothetical protein
LQQVNGADVSRSPLPARWHRIGLTNNMIVNNVAGWAGGGISMADTLRATIFNNTIVSNDSTGIAGVVLAGTVPLPAATPGQAGVGRPSPSGLVSELTSAALVAALPTAALRTANAISQPVALTNNIVYQNRSFYYSGDGRLCTGNDVAAVGGTCSTLPNQSATGQCAAGAAYWDLGVLGDTNPTPGTRRFNPTDSILTSVAGYGGAGNRATSPGLADPYCNGSRMMPELGSVTNPPTVFNLQVAATLDEGNNYVNLRYGPLFVENPSTKEPFGDYHLAGTGSPAYNQGTSAGAPNHDVDGQARPAAGRVDIGADELSN